MCMWSSRCLINWLPWYSTTKRFYTVCCFAPVPRPCWRLLLIPNILALTSASLACSTHRGAISNHRIVDFSDGKLTFLWKDYANGSKRRLMTLTAEEFLRRFLIHTLPRGFIRIRFFGFLASRRRGASLPLCKQLLEADPRSISPPPALPAPPPALWVCPHCSGPMVVAERLTAQQIREELLRQKILVDTS